MDEEAVQLRACFSRLTDEELLRVVTAGRAEYRRAALELAAAELSRRGLPLPVAPPERLAEDDGAEPEAPGVSTRARLVGLVPLLLVFLAAWSATQVIDTLLNPVNPVLRWLLNLSLLVGFYVTLLAAWKQFFPESYERVRGEESQEAEAAEAAEGLKAELRVAAERALDQLGLDWEARDIYADSYGYHVDFYDATGRLRAAVFERPPDGGWKAEAVARRLREMAAEPERLPPVSVEGLRQR